VEAKSPCVDEIYGALATLGEVTDKLTDSGETLTARVAAVESRMQLVDQEWSDWYSKSRALEERIAKREERAKARARADTGEEDAGDDAALAQIIGGGAAPEDGGQPMSDAARAFLLKRGRR
jgi:hypothetical protein